MQDGSRLYNVAEAGVLEKADRENGTVRSKASHSRRTDRVCHDSGDAIKGCCEVVGVKEELGPVGGDKSSTSWARW